MRSRYVTSPSPVVVPAVATTRAARAAAATAALFAAVALLLLACAPAVPALEPPRPGELAQLKREGKLDEALARARALGNYRVSPDLLESARLRAERAALGITAPAPPSGWRGMPTTGSVKILTLLIDFSDYPHKNPASTINAKLFGAGASSSDFPYESLHDYYQRSSYNQLDIAGDVLGWYRPGYSRASMGANPTDAQRENLIKEALTHYEGLGHDFSQYDNSGDGAIDYFVVVWTGPQGAWSSFWWGYQTSWQYTSSPVLDGKTLNAYSWQWECSYTNGVTDGVYDQIVVMHETGHALGLPDYYDYDDTKGPDGGLGGLDMMDTNWGDHNAFSKWILDWITPQVVTGPPQSVTLSPSGTGPSALVVMPTASASDPFREYFVVQNRQRVGNDSNCVTWPYQDMPGDGLLIWHVDARLKSTSYGDDYLYDNSYTAHKLLRLMEADGLNQIETVANYWTQAADYYTGGQEFTDTSNPNSKRYDGSASGVAVTGIPSPSASMTFTAGVDGTPTADTTPPHTTASGYDTAWHDTPVTVTFSAADDAGGSGVDYTEYQMDALDWKQGTSVVVPAEPDTVHAWTIKYRSVDKAGNVEPYHSVQVKIDTTGTADSDDVPGLPIPASPFGGTLDAATDRHDVYSIQLNAGETLRASITGPADVSNFDLFLFSPGTLTVNVSGGEVVKTSSAVYPDAFSYLVPQSGTYYLDAFAYSGGGSYTVTYSVAVDTVGPVCAAKDVAVRRGRTARVYFKVFDEASAQVTTVVKITTRSGVVKKRWSWGYRPNSSAWSYAKYTCRLAKGRYRIVVTGRDLSGNAQSRIGRATLTVR